MPDMAESHYLAAEELPPAHLIQAALQAASLLDRRGSTIADAHESYWRQATGGTLQPADLMRGQQLLIICSLIEERRGVLHPNPELLELLAGTIEEATAHIIYRFLTSSVITITAPPAVSGPRLNELVPDPARREELLVLLDKRFDDSLRREVGAIGEEIVSVAARDELHLLGHSELARQVRRVSLLSDQLGYDVSAPRLNSTSRLLEVKATTTMHSDNEITIYLTRTELEAGLRYANQWALVICHVTSVNNRRGDIIGWCGAAALAEMVPTDKCNARWETTSMHIPPELLEPGLPRPSL